MTLLAFTTTLALATMTALSDTGPADPCAARKPGASITAFIAAPAPRAAAARDTIVTASVCVLPARTATKRVGSYHGELYFDSTAASVVRVERPAGGLRVENATRAGQVNFAGAAPTGFASGALLHVTLRVRHAGARPALRLKMLELNATDGTNLMPRLVTAPSP